MSRRKERAETLLRNVVATAILQELKDPRMRGLISVTRVEISKDLKFGTVFVSIFGSEADVKLSLKALQEARGYLQQAIVRETDMRFIPKLKFKIDETMMKQQRVTDLLRGVLPANTSKSHNDSDWDDDNEDAKRPAWQDEEE